MRGDTRHSTGTVTQKYNYKLVTYHSNPPDRFMRNNLCCVSTTACCSCFRDLCKIAVAGSFLPRFTSTSSEQGMGMGSGPTTGHHPSPSLTEALVHSPSGGGNDDYVVDDGASVESDDPAERESAVETGRRSSRILTDPEPDNQLTSPSVNPMQSPHKTTSPAEVSGERRKGSSMSGGSDTRARVPPSERMLRFSPNDEVQYYEREDNDGEVRRQRK